MHAWTTLQKGYAMQRDASDTRVNPDLILKAIEKDEVADDARTSRGHLKIFFGYAAGAGKTYAMLQAAHAAKRRGVDVVAGDTSSRTNVRQLPILHKGLRTCPVNSSSTTALRSASSI